MDNRRSRLLWLWIIIGVVFAALLFIVALSWVEIDREQIYSDTEAVNRPIEPFSLCLADWERYVETNFPDDCRDNYLTSATVELHFQDGAVLEGQTTLRYFRYIDDSMEGGNVALTEFVIDLPSGTLTQIVRSHGSGRSLSAGGTLVTGNTPRLPLDLYLQHAAELTGSDANEPMRLYAYYSGSQLDINLLDEKHEHLLYGEIVSDWDSAAGFDERVLSERTVR